MNRQQTGLVVRFLTRTGLLQALDEQTAVWHEIIGDLDPDDAMTACKTLATERVGADRWVTPGDLIVGVRRVRSARIANVTAPAPPIPLDVEEDIAWRRAYITARADGLGDQGAQESANREHGIIPQDSAKIPAPTPRLRSIAPRMADVPDRRHPDIQHEHPEDVA